MDLCYLSSVSMLKHPFIKGGSLFIRYDIKELCDSFRIKPRRVKSLAGGAVNKGAVLATWPAECCFRSVNIKVE